MGSSGGGGGSPSSFTGGGPRTMPPMAAPGRGPTPSYASVLPTSGSMMATPESVAAALAAAPPPQPMAPQQQGMDPNMMRQMMAQMMGPRRMTGQELFMTKLGKPPDWYTPEVAKQQRNDNLMRVFAGSMAGRGGGGGFNRGGSK